MIAVITQIRKEFSIGSHLNKQAFIITTNKFNNADELQSYIGSAQLEGIDLRFLHINKKAIPLAKQNELNGSYNHIGADTNKLEEKLESFIRPNHLADKVNNPFEDYISGTAVSIAALVSDTLKKSELRKLEKALLKSKEIAEAGFTRNALTAFTYSGSNGLNLVIDQYGIDTSSIYKKESTGIPTAKALEVQRHHLNNSSAKNKVAILFTNGDASICKDVAEQVQLAQKEGITILALLYGNRINQELVPTQFPGVDYPIQKIKKIVDAVEFAIN